MKNIDPATPRRAVAAALAVVALVGTLALLFQRTRSVDLEGNRAIVSALRQLERIDAEWNVAVLRSRAGVATEPDPVTRALPLIASLQARLGERADGSWADETGRARLAPLLADFTTAMEQKIALIERRGSHDTLVRNAARALPAAGAELIDAARNRLADKRMAADLQDTAATLVAEALAYLLAPAAPLRARIEDHEAALGALAARAPADFAELVEPVRAHVRAVLQQQTAGDDLRAQLAAVPTASTLDRLLDAYGEETRRLLDEQQMWTLGMLGYAALVLSLLGWQGWRLLRSERLRGEDRAALARATRELRAMQAALVQSARMAALGQVAAGVAHEINPPLAQAKDTLGVLREQITLIGALARRSLVFTELLAARERDPESLGRAYAEVRRLANDLVERGRVNELGTLIEHGAAGIDQAAALAVDVETFSRLDRTQVTLFDVRAGLETTLRLARHLLKHRFTVIREFGDVARIACAPAQINQLFLHLVVNAAHAVPADRDGFLTLRTEMDDARTVRIEIQDNGTGFAQDVLPKIFDPCFATRLNGAGTGLSIAHAIVKQHGGAILVDTEVDVGTVFTILLPVESPTASAPVRAEAGVAA